MMVKHSSSFFFSKNDHIRTTAFTSIYAQNGLFVVLDAAAAVAVVVVMNEYGDEG